MKWKKHTRELIGVIVYLSGFLIALVIVFALTLSAEVPKWLSDHALAVRSMLCGGLGGAIYLLRAVYLRCCVHDDWTGGWLPWYFIRPLVSVLCGFVAFVFLSAGLVILDGTRTDGAGEFGFYALAILAGLNVDRFVARIEEVGKAAFGIEKSRTSDRSTSNK